MSDGAQPDNDPPVPEVHLRWVADAQARFQTAIEGLDDERVRSPSLLPGWSIGHVLTHVARNADSHRRRADAAARGAIVEQYVGGYAGRASEIDTGAGRPALELVEDVKASGESLRAAWSRLPVEAWSREVSDVVGRVHLLPKMLRFQSFQNATSWRGCVGARGQGLPELPPWDL